MQTFLGGIYGINKMKDEKGVCYMKIFIKNSERGLLFEKGNYVRCLKPGSYFFMPFKKFKVMAMDINQPFCPKELDIDLFMHDKVLLDELDIIDVKDNQIAIHYIDGRLTDVYTTGKYAFWKQLKTNTFEVIDITDPEIDDTIDKNIFYHKKLRGKFVEVNIEAYEKAVLLYNNKMHKILEPGRYFYWNQLIHVAVKKVDMRRCQMDMTGQEIMTADKVTLRLNFVCQYKIKDVIKATLEIKQYESQIYILLQLILREYVGTIKLDELLKMKQEIGDFVLSRLKEKEGELGIEFIFAGVKDIILPGEIKDILNTVLLAEKKAQAKVITRREEIASTRSLLNTAKLMDENKTLYKLKELEYLEKICDKVGHISLSGVGNIIDKLQELIG